MANNTSNPNRTSLATRIAAEQKQAADVKRLQQRTAAAWTLAKTMLPSAPPAQQLKVAQNLLFNPSPVLFGMLRQAAVNAHYTHIAEEFKAVHKVDMNDLLEDPSVLSKEKAAVTSEVKGDAKNASAKIADDRKENGVQPETYDEGKRTEPADLDADGAGDRPKEDKSKEASKKIACGKECKGCDGCNKEASQVKKTAEEEAAPESKTEESTETKPEEGKEDAAPLEGEEEKHEESADEAGAVGEDAAEAGDDLGAEGAEDEVFDEEKATLQDAIDDVQKDVEVLQEAIEAEIGDASDINLTEEAVDDGAFDAALEEGAEPGMLDGLEGMEVPPADPGAPEGEELNIEGIFSDDNFADKVSALKDENSEEVIEGFDSFFEPSDAAELEGALDQEEAIMSPADMFAVEEGDEHNDPMALLFASAKQAGESEEVVKPGTLDNHFETDLAGDDRDGDTDHEGDIFSDVLKSLKADPTGDHRDKQDAVPELKAPDKTAGKKVAGKTFPKLATHFDPLNTKIAGGNLANLIFGDEADFS